MRARHKIWLAAALILFPVMIGDFLLGRSMIEDRIRTELMRDAETVRGLLMATRRVYQQQFLSSGLPVNEKTIGFLPAHALSRISTDFPNWSRNGLYFNNVSDTPRNPANMADASELEAIAFFRANPKAEQRVVEVKGVQGESLLHYTAPIRVEPYCLKCHGDRSEAPASIASLYDKAYGYNAGDLRGVMSIKLPTDTIRQREMQDWRQGLLVHLTAYAVLFVMLGTFMNRVITRRLGRIHNAIRAIREGDYTPRIGRMDGGDELAELARMFDHMAETIEQRDTALQASEEAQRKRLNFINAIFDTANSLIVVLDRQGHIERMNRAGESLVGYTCDEIKGKHFWDVFLLDGEREAVKSVFSTIFAGGTVSRYENHWRCKDGGVRLFDWSNSALLDEHGAVEYLVSVGVDITKRKALEFEVWHLAYSDPLTNLPNRRLFQDRLQQAVAASKRSGLYGALMFLDLDKFKSLNDTFGHSAGDVLLTAVADRIRACVRATDTVARFAGDEFVVLLVELGANKAESIAQAGAVAEKIRSALSEPYALTLQREGDVLVTIAHSCTASIGVTLFGMDPQDVDLDAILKRADMSMYQVKQSGRNSVRIG